MSTAGSSTARSNNSKGNPPTTGRKDKTSSLKTDVIMDNTAKARGDDDPDSSDSEGNPRRGDKRGGRPYDKEDDDGSGKVRVAKPDKYHGEREKLEPWLLQLSMWFWDHDTPTIEGKRTVYASSLMRGRALKWIQPLLKEFLDNKEDDEGIFANYKKFQKKIRMTFGTTNDKEYAIRVVKTLRQNTSASEYVAKFEEYAPQTEWDDEALMEMFRDGLKPSVQQELVRERDQIKTLQKLEERAIRIDDQLYTQAINLRYGRRGQASPAPRTPYAYPHQTSRIKPDYGDPMDLSATTKARPRSGKVEKKGPGGRSNSSVENKKCYACGKVGHFARDCRSRNLVNRNETLASVTQQLNVIEKEYFTEVSDPGSEPWEDVSDLSDTQETRQG